MGTVVEITVALPDEEAARAAMISAFEEFERVDSLASHYREGSEVSKLNAAGESVLSEEMFSLLQRSRELSERTGGAFDVTVGPLVALWGFTEGGRVPGADEIERALGAVGYERLALEPGERRAKLLDPGMMIDLGAVGKGYAVDRAAAVLRAAGIDNAIIDAGGDLRLLGGRPGKGFWRIGIRHPRDPARFLASLDLEETAVVTSGDYERFFVEDGQRYHHLLDPATGRPATVCQSVTVTAPTAEQADALATAAFVLGPLKGLELLRSIPEVEGIIVAADGEVLWSDEGRLGR